MRPYVTKMSMIFVIRENSIEKKKSVLQIISIWHPLCPGNISGLPPLRCGGLRNVFCSNLHSLPIVSSSLPSGRTAVLTSFGVAMWLALVNDMWAEVTKLHLGASFTGQWATRQIPSLLPVTGHDSHRGRSVYLVPERRQRGAEPPAHPRGTPSVREK